MAEANLAKNALMNSILCLSGETDVEELEFAVALKPTYRRTGKCKFLTMIVQPEPSQPSIFSPLLF